MRWSVQLVVWSVYQEMPRTKKSEAVRLKELDVLQGIIASPLVLFVASFAAIEALQKYGVVGNVAGSVAETGLGAIAVAQAIGPSLPGILGAIQAPVGVP